MTKQDSFDLKRPDFDAAEFAWKVSGELFIDQLMKDNKDLTDFFQARFPQIPPEDNQGSKVAPRWGLFRKWYNFQCLEGFFLRQYLKSAKRKPCKPKRVGSYRTADIQFTGYSYVEKQHISNHELAVFAEVGRELRSMELKIFCLKLLHNIRSIGANELEICGEVDEDALDNYIDESCAAVIKTLGENNYDFFLSLFNIISYVNSNYKITSDDIEEFEGAISLFDIRDLIAKFFKGAKKIDPDDSANTINFYHAVHQADPIFNHFCNLKMLSEFKPLLKNPELKNIGNIFHRLLTMAREATDNLRDCLFLERFFIRLRDIQANPPVSVFDRMKGAGKKEKSSHSEETNQLAANLTSLIDEWFRGGASDCDEFLNKALKNLVKNDALEESLEKVHAELQSFKYAHNTALSIIVDFLKEFKILPLEIGDKINPKLEANIFYGKFNLITTSDLTIMNYFYDHVFSEGLKVGFIIQHLTWNINELDDLIQLKDVPSWITDNKDNDEMKELLALKKKYPRSFSGLVPLQKHFTDFFTISSGHMTHMKYQYSDQPSASAIREVRDLKVQDNSSIVRFAR